MKRVLAIVLSLFIAQEGRAAVALGQNLSSINGTGAASLTLTTTVNTGTNLIGVVHCAWHDATSVTASATRGGTTATSGYLL